MSRNRVLVRAAALLAVAALAGACTEELGTDRVLGFSDRTNRGSAESGLDLAIARGARIDVQVTRGGAEATVTSATSTAPNVLEVTARRDAIVSLLAVSSGLATLRVEVGDKRDAIDLRVAEIAESRIVIHPWAPIFPFEDALFADGLAILPDAPVTIFLDHRDDRGNPLTGHGAVTPTLEGSGDGTSLRQEGDQPDTDFWTLRSGDARELVVRAGATATRFEPVEPGDVARIAVYDPITKVLVPSREERLDLVVGKSVVLHVAGWTDSGAWVIGAGPTFQIRAPNAQLALSIEVPGSIPDADPDLERMLRNGRAFFLTANGAGEANLEVEWAGQSATIPLRVTAPE